MEQPMRIYNQAGDHFYLKPREWDEILIVAEGNGWKPAGTAEPAVDFDSTTPRRWDGNYSQPCGQIMKRSDVQAMATALNTHVGSEGAFRSTTALRVRALLAFCGSGSLLLAAGGNADAEKESSVGTQLAALGSVLGLGRAVTPARETETHRVRQGVQ
jgi:hypothetical protein